MPTEQIELTAAQTDPITEQTELIEKLNCLEFETAQLNRAYQLWRSYVEQGTAPHWMAAATRITYDALIRFCLEVSAILADVPHTFSTRPQAQSEATHWEISGIVGTEGATAEASPELQPMTEPDGSGQTEITTEQTELIEKLNCLELETAQLNRAYQLWRPYVEQGTAPDWMTAAIRITYDALITFSLELSTILADVPPAFSARPLTQLEAAPCEIAGILGEESTTVELSPQSLPTMEPDCSEPEMPAAISPPLTGDTILQQPVIQQGQQEEETDVPHASSARLLPQLKSAAHEVSGILEGESTTTWPSPELLPAMEPDPSGPEMPAVFSPLSTSDAIWEQSTIPQDHQEAESTTAESSPESLPMTERDWSAPEMPVAFSPPSTGDMISEQPAIQPGQHKEEAGAEPATVHTLAMLAADWLRGSSTGVLFFIPPGALGRIVRATSVGILIAAIGTIGVYVVSARRAASRLAILPVQNSATQAAAGLVAIPSGERAEFKFDPDPVVALPGRSFVLNAVLSGGSDIASMAVQIDYDANLLQFMGASEGGFLVKDGYQVVLGQRNDPSTGVLRISAEKSPGTPGISGDGPVFALSFQARKRGKATVSIVPGAHDSQGRRIEMAGSQVSVKVN